MYRCTSGHINESRSIPQVVEVFIDEELSPLSVLWWTEARNQLLAGRALGIFGMVYLMVHSKYLLLTEVSPLVIIK